MTAILIEFTIKASLILVITFTSVMLLRRRSAALRHTVWTVGLLCSLAIPLFSFVLPVWHVQPIAAVQPSPSVIASLPIVTQSGPIVVSAPAAASLTPSQTTPERLLLLIWVLGVLSVASLLLREAVRLARVAFGASTVQQSSWRDLVREVSLALTLTRRVHLMRNSNASVLGTWGTIRPRVLLPRESETWSDERMRVVLGHELAHVKRNDWLVQIIAESARAIYWFNPLFWIACRELRRESEHACDDAAMNLGGPLLMDGPTYAGHVLDLARTLKHSAQPTSAALAMAGTSNLERRLVAMLNPSLNRRVTGKGTALIVALLALGLTLPLAALSSQAPVPAVSVTPAVEFISLTPGPAAASAVAAVPVAPRPVPRSVALAATARPTVETVQPSATQNQGGTLSGTIMDPTGAVIPGAKINMTAQSTGIRLQTLSTDTGSFAFTQLPPDTYSGTVDVRDFKQGKFSYLVSDPNSIARLNITLALGLTTVIEISVAPPPGLKCFSVFGAFKSDGTPFTEAECPGGTSFIAPPVAAGPPPATPEVVSVNSPPASIPAGGQRPIRVGGDVQAGNLLYHPSPAYPSEARNRGIEGVVIVSAVIAEDGLIRSLKIIRSSNALLETGVLDTIQYWRYKPTLLNREPVEVISTITLNFTLNR